MLVKLKFPENMYNSTLGSFLVTKVILGKMTEEDARKEWKKRRKYKDRLLDFGEDTSNMCIVKSKFNTLVMPYYVPEGETEPVILPLREDGIYPTTFRYRTEVVYG